MSAEPYDLPKTVTDYFEKVTPAQLEADMKAAGFDHWNRFGGDIVDPRVNSGFDIPARSSYIPTTLMKRPSKPTQPAGPLKLEAYQMSDILESGLLSPERIAEIEAAMVADTSAVYDANGKLAVNAKIITQGGKRVLILDGSDQDYARDYHRRNHFAEFLTQDEIARLNTHTFSARQARRDAEQFEKAEKIDAKDWLGWVCDGGDHYHSSVEDWLDEWAGRYDPSDDLPTHVWAAEPEMVLGAGLDIEDVLQDSIENRGWEDCDSSCFSGATELQAALDHFVHINRDVISYRENTKKAILVEGLCRMHLADEEGRRTGIHPIHQRRAKLP